MTNYFTQKTGFYKNTSPGELIEKYGSPLYVYSEEILRKRCREMANLIPVENFNSNFSIKANSNLHLLKIAREEGLHADAMSPGEIFVLEKAGYLPEEILFIANNVSAGEMEYAIKRNITVSIDSLSQLDLLGRTNPGAAVAIRFNPGVGAGHHEKVITGGRGTKFGVDIGLAGEVRDLLKKYSLKLMGINQHIGSLFMEPDTYVESAKEILAIANGFEDLEFVDFGGGFGIPYRKQENQPPLDLKRLGDTLSTLVMDWRQAYGKNVRIKIEPGRYVVAECGVLLGTVHAIKKNGDYTYVGTDLGFNNLMRPVLYDSHHEVEIYEGSGKREVLDIVGNICETGDILAKGRYMEIPKEGSIIGVMDAGAYGYSMASNYNNRLRPAEVLIGIDSPVSLIRERDTFKDLIRGF